MGVRLHVRALGTSRSEEEVVYAFDQDRILVGRGRGADVCLPRRAVSVRHATIELSGSRYTVVDHGSTNGTRVGETRLVPGRPKPLRDGDRVELGGFVLVFRSNVAVTEPTSAERTASLARRLAREAIEGRDAELRPSVVVTNGPAQGTRVFLSDPPTRLLIGRGDHCQLVIDDADASREHAELEVSLEGTRLRDLGSKNGLSVAGRPSRERVLEDRDEILVGATVLVYEDPAGARVRELEDGEDEVAVEPPRPPVVEAPDPAEWAGEPASEPEPAPHELSPPRPRAPSIAPGDMVIYVLASVVFAVSLLGLFWLVRA